MSTIKLNNNIFSVTFYPDSTLSPNIRCCTDDNYGMDEERSITYEDAKQLIEGLQNFVQTVDKKKQEVSDRVASLGLEKYYQQ